MSRAGRRVPLLWRGECQSGCDSSTGSVCASAIGEDDISQELAGSPTLPGDAASPVLRHTRSRAMLRGAHGRNATERGASAPPTAGAMQQTAALIASLQARASTLELVHNGAYITTLKFQGSRQGTVQKVRSSAQPMVTDDQGADSDSSTSGDGDCLKLYQPPPIARQGSSLRVHSGSFTVKRRSWKRNASQLQSLGGSAPQPCGASRQLHRVPPQRAVSEGPDERRRARVERLASDAALSMEKVRAFPSAQSAIWCLWQSNHAPKRSCPGHLCMLYPLRCK